MSHAPRRRRGFIRDHSLSLVLTGVVLLWLVLYVRADPSTHAGSFFGNALADWLGTLVFVIATKYFFEAGSKESRRPHPKVQMRLARFIVRHSLTLVLGLTGLVWIAGFARQDPGSRWGQVTGNIASEWTQILGLVLITKYAREVGAKID